MENVFRKLCLYYIMNESIEELEKIKEENPESFEKNNEKAQKLIELLKEKCLSKGFSIDFEGFCEYLEYYINEKDKMTDKEKAENLKLLMTLSEIHEINLREELERYVTYKKVPISEEKQQEIFNRFCSYNLKTNNNIEDYNELKKIASENDLDFKELQKQSIIFIEEIKILAERIGYDLEQDDFEYIMNDYLNKKSHLSDFEKTKYLKLLLYLSDILKIDLRERLTEEKNTQSIENKEKNSNLTFSNPLENKELLNEMLNQRYHNGYFEIRELYLPSENIKIDNKEYDKYKLQADLTYKLYRIFLDKFSNYAFDDLNEKYLNLITEADLERLETITREEIYEILKTINKRESSHYICKKYKLTDNLYNFINESTLETTDIDNKNIGINKNSLFIINSDTPTIEISFNGPDFELNLLLNEYIKKCVENNLNYAMNNFINEKYRNKCIVFASSNDIKEKIEIINEILDKYPNIKNKLQKPALSCSFINDYIFGINHIGINNIDENKISYNEVFNNISEIAYYRVLAKIISGVITDEKAKSIINNFINLKNVDFKDFNDILLTEYNSINFSTIKDLINQYIPLISSTLSIYMSEITKKDELIEEFKKSIMYISNLLFKKDKKQISNIALNEEIEQL